MLPWCTSSRMAIRDRQARAAFDSSSVATTPAS
jgi:hypothetical protein